MKLKHINTILLVLIVFINAYIIVAPFVPGMVFRWQKHEGKTQQLQRVIHASRSNPSSPATSRANQVIVPSMVLDTPILEGPVAKQYQILDSGVWRWPRGSTPDKGGNTVLIGHRFTYTNPRGIFYLLNKVQLGDEIGVIWNDKSYLYKVVGVDVVPPNDSGIENNTSYPELTLFTCTPLWLPKDRLVIVASLEAKP